MDRQEAINILRGYKYSEEEKKALGILIPELRESEDEKMRKMAIKAVKSPEAQSCIKSWGVNPDDVIAWLEKQKKQKPAEWSEEDEKMREHLISDLREFRYCETDEELIEDYEDEIQWLQSLRPQPHWKPSSLELQALKTAIHILTEERNFPKAAQHLKDILDHFNGEETRQDWKPTEEQMQELNFARLGRTPNVVNEKLDSLYQDLLKLK